MPKAYVETTVLTNALLKPWGPAQEAEEAIARHSPSLLPVYAIKEFKAGPLVNYRYAHDKLLSTGSLQKTLLAIRDIHRQRYKMSTALEALGASCTLITDPLPPVVGADLDRELALRFRLAIKSLIFLGWDLRRSVTTETVDDLDCYRESKPYVDKQGFVELKPTQCDADQECCLAVRFRSRPDLLQKLHDSISPEETKTESVKRRQVLRDLLRKPKEKFTRDQCRKMGDAVFAFCAPQDAVILTTNISDHKPLAEALGKTAEFAGGPASLQMGFQLEAEE